MTKKTMKEAAKDVIANSLSGLSAYFGGNIDGQQINKTDTMHLNLRGYLISNDRALLSRAYVEYGIVQTLIDQPVDDAFRAGFEIKSSELSPEDIEELETYVERNKAIAELIQGLKWARLFGGGAVIIINGDNYEKPLLVDAIKQDAILQFRAVDLWELYRTDVIAQGDSKLEDEPEFYTYYGKSIHKSRVFPLYGKRAPSFIYPSLRGWGMSELERIVSSFNSYIKNSNVVFELLDEAKIDVYKMKGFNSALLTNSGTTGVATRIQNANMIKNYQNAITMDTDDEYEQKQVTFTGLGEMLTQIRQGVAADLRMPMTKLFGISAAGFSSGEDDIENYNSMVESEIRAKVKGLIADILNLCCQAKFGYVPGDIKIVFKPLRMLSAKEEEEVKTSQFNRTMSSYQSGLVPAEEAKKGINKAHLLPVEIDEDIPALPPTGGNDLAGASGASVTE